MIPRSLHGPQHHIELVVVGGVVVHKALLGLVPHHPAGDGGIRAGDVMVRRIVAAADVVAHDVEPEPFVAVEQIGSPLGQIVRIAQTVGPPAQAGAPALEHAAMVGGGVCQGNGHGLGSGVRGRSGHAAAEHEEQQPRQTFAFHGGKPPFRCFSNETFLHCIMEG